MSAPKHTPTTAPEWATPIMSLQFDRMSRKQKDNVETLILMGFLSGIVAIVFGAGAALDPWNSLSIWGSVVGLAFFVAGIAFVSYSASLCTHARRRATRCKRYGIKP